MSQPSIVSSDSPRKLIERPATRTGPRRSAANFYRSASGSGVVIGGVPMDTVEDAVTAAVRMGYKIAQAQIDRTTRIAQRFKDAGERAAGPHSDRQALDANNHPTETPRPPEVWETGFKDTVIAYPGEVTRVRGRFDVEGLFVWHCHIVEHEDNEMMRPYAIGPIPLPTSP